jgi:iron(III) transport system substrate-binding protein
MRSKALISIIAAAGIITPAILLSSSAAASEEVNLYSFRQPFLLKPLTDAFTKQTGITVNAVYAQNGVLERIKAEGANTAADAVLTVDIGRLYEMAKAGVLDSIHSPILDAAIPQSYRDPDGQWFSLTSRARVIYVSKDRVAPGAVTTYDDLTKPEYRGKVCIRSAKNDYNVALIAAMIAHRGEAGAETWLRGLKANLARKPQGNDRAQAKAIYEGECDVALANTYYMGIMATNEKEPVQKKWAAASRIVFPNKAGTGTHINVSGAGVVKSARNKANAIKLLEFLVSDEAQQAYAEDNMEYPIKAGVAIHPMVASWGTLTPDTLSLKKVAEQRAAATRLVDKVGIEFGPGS